MCGTLANFQPVFALGFLAGEKSLTFCMSSVPFEVGTALLVISLFTMGCQLARVDASPPISNSPVADGVIPTNDIPFREVFRDKITSVALHKSIGNTVLQSESEYSDFLSSRDISVDSWLGRALKLNFVTETGILVVLPVQNDVGPDVSLVLIDSESSSFIKVQPIRLLPMRGGNAGATLSMPTTYVSIKKLNVEFRFLEPIDIRTQ